MVDPLDQDQLAVDGYGDGDTGGAVEEGEPQQVIKAIPTFIVAGTLQGGVFRANLATCNIHVESGLLICLLSIE